MAALQCEICGGKLTGKPGGLFECEYCGVQYDTAWAKAKIQEIKGTVKVEGTVEVQGTVKIEGPVKVEGAVNLESLLKRGYLALEDQEWKMAFGFFDDALNINAECGHAYLGKLMAELQIRKPKDLKDCTEPFDNNNNYYKVMRFGDVALQREVEAAAHIVRKNRDTRISEKWKLAQNHLVVGWNHTFGLKADGVVNVTEYYGEETENYGQGNVSAWTDIVAITEGFDHTVGLKSYGAVVAVGRNTFGQCNVEEWTDIVAIASNDEYTLGLKADGTVVAVGNSAAGVCDVSSWNDIVSVSAGFRHIIGLKEDGTVVAAGDNEYGQCNVSSWTDIVSVYTSDNTTFGIKSNGTVVAVGDNEDGMCNVSSWRNIISLSVGCEHVVGLKSNGTVVAVGNNEDGRCDVRSWHDIVAVDTDYAYTIGLKADGTVVIAGKMEGEDWAEEPRIHGWTDIIAISADTHQAVGLKKNGTIVAEGYEPGRNWEVEQWKLFDELDELKVRKTLMEAKKEHFNAACRLMDAKYSEEDILEAKEMFRELGDFHNAKEKLAVCEEIYSKLKRERLYLEACNAIKQINAHNINFAMKKFCEVGDWKDSYEKVVWCEKKLQILREIDRVQEKRNAFENELTHLGLLLFKRRKEITEQLQQISIELVQLEKEKELK